MNTIINAEEVIEQFIDYLMPELTPYETKIYLYLLQHSHLKNNKNTLRVGKRTIDSGVGMGSKSKGMKQDYIKKLLGGLEEKGCITIGEKSRLGTFYTINLPIDTSICKKKMCEVDNNKNSNNIDYFTNENKRRVIFERDNWTCQYCGEVVNVENATIDHHIPQSKGGGHTKDNLKTCCFICNSIKSGKSYEEAAPLLLENIKQRRVKSNDSQ